MLKIKKPYCLVGFLRFFILFFCAELRGIAPFCVGFITKLLLNYRIYNIYFFFFYAMGIRFDNNVDCIAD